MTFRVEGQVFCSAEQAYQFFKCRTCKRDERADKILGMSNLLDIKIAGDDITTKAVWEQNKEGFMRSICYSKFSQNEELRRKLIDTGDITLYECTNNRWWGSGYHLDSPEWATTKCPGLNKLGTILMDIRTTLKKASCTTDALWKSPGSIIKSMQKMEEDIQAKVSEITAPPIREPDKPTDMETDTVEEKLTQPENNDGDKEEGSDINSSVADSEDMLDPTDIEEDSVNISATSTISEMAVANVTGADGKLDISKIKNWKIPKLNELDPSLNNSYISGRTRRQLSQSATTSSAPAPPSAVNAAGS